MAGDKKPKISRAGLYKKGRAYEYELRDHFIGYGMKCRRVTQSGGGSEKDDLVLLTGWGEEYRIEAKRRAKLPAYLVNDGCHATIFRPDRGKSMVLIPLDRFCELIQCR
jgi:Holliday junction resolvase